jgi:ABC-type glycerol-3-phosphate transport system substrate-binding protein
MAGNSPDIIEAWLIPFDTLIARGLLIDLYPLIDNDHELSRELFIQNVFKASETDGKLYRLVPSFSLGTIFGSPLVLGDYPGWNIAEFFAVLEDNPGADLPGGSFVNDLWFLSLVLMDGVNSFVDRESGTTDFENDGFIELLEAVKRFPNNSDWSNTYSEWDLIAEGRQIMNVLNFGQFDFLLSYRAWFGGDIILKGYPTENRNGNVFIPYTNIAISVNCTDVDAAWEFVRIFITEEFQREMYPWSIPVNKVVFEEELNKLMEPTGISFFPSDGMEIEILPFTQNEVDMLYSSIINTTRLRNVDETLWDIISESASDFFNGIITAEDAARIIQNRASIYIAEQHG